MGRWFRLAALLCIGVVSLCVFPRDVYAAEGDDGVTRFVLLNVPGGGTDQLAATLEERESVEVEGQSWFVEQIKSRGMTPKKIMKRTEDLAFVMEDAKIDFILYFTGGEKEPYTVHVVDASGEEAHSFSADRTDEGLSESAAAAVRADLESSVLEAPEDDPAPEEEPDVEESEDEPDGKKEEPDEEPAEDAETDAWVWVSAMGRAFKRDVTLAGANGAVLTYQSSFYPGFEASLETYPGVVFAPGLSNVGLFVDYRMGFDSVGVSVGDSTTSLPITHMEIEGGPIYRVETSVGTAESTRTIQLRFRGTARHSRYTLRSNPTLPSITRTAVVLGTSISHPLLADAFAVEGRVDVIPVSFFGGESDLFGDSSFGYGFSSALGGRYDITASIAAIFGYGFRLMRTSFSGQGSLDFSETEVFELVHGGNVGVLYHY